MSISKTYKESITIIDTEYRIKNCYVKSNVIYIKLYNKNNRRIKLISVDKFLDVNSTQKDPPFSRILNSIKIVVNKYIRKLTQK